MGEKLQWDNLKLPSTLWGIMLGGIYFAAMWYSVAFSPETKQVNLRLSINIIFFIIFALLWKAFKLAPMFWSITLGTVYLMSSWIIKVHTLPLFWLALYIILQIIFYMIVRAVWYYFFAQFILPVQTNSERNKIFIRLIKKSRGAALFIKNGKLIESEGEREKSGEGVIVLDSASAVVVRKNNQYTKAAGPGVLFTDKGETVAGAPVPLQKLRDTIGPKGNEDPFVEKSNAIEEEEYDAIQRRRYETSALTRDAVEIVPNINVIFKIDANPAKENEDGSRFGYNEDAVRKAIWHTTIDHKNDHKELYWNQLPVHLAADLWREYLAKYRFEELFKADQEVRAIPEYPKTNTDTEKAPEKPEEVKYDYNARGLLCDMLRSMNMKMEKKINEINERLSPPIQEEEKPIETVVKVKKEPPTKETALQSITRFMAQRLKEPFYTPTDNYGNIEYTEDPKPSPEYNFLKERGIRVITVKVNNLRFDEYLEKDMISNWPNTWLNNAKDEKAYIENQIQHRKTLGKENALLEYANDLSVAISKENLHSPEDALKILLKATRQKIIRDEGLHKAAEEDIQRITDLIIWINKGGQPLG
jgi:hypothetical protein